MIIRAMAPSAADAIQAIHRMCLEYTQLGSYTRVLVSSDAIAQRSATCTSSGVLTALPELHL